MERYKVLILTPVYNDWQSFRVLAQRIENQFPEKEVCIIAVNDGSNVSEFRLNDYRVGIRIIHLFRNLGHQKAIAVGLTYCVGHFDFDHVVVMDSDGEDSPEDILPMLALSGRSGGKVIFAKRTKRKEGPLFRFFYLFYKIVFRLLTGTSISFGNFCVLSKDLASKVIYVSEIWNHFSGGIIKSRLPYELLPLERGSRIHGKSKMNFQSLILHGLSSIAVHIETVAVRILIASLALLLLSLLSIGVVAFIRLFTDNAIPGWTSNMIIGLSAVFLLSLVLSLLLIFIILNNRNQRSFLPALESPIFISSTESNYDTGR